jgi:L-ascorbate metabolism protein UlaG (beta-lactamase superfamily)
MEEHHMKKKQCVTITWLGHSAFHILTAKGTSILIDPWLKNPKAPPNIENITPVDIILISHGHSDHIGNAIEIAARTGAMVIAIYEIAQYLTRKGVANAQSINKGGSKKIQDVRITMVDAKHSSDIDAEGAVTPGGEAAGFIIECENGPTMYHAGDTSVFSDMVLIGKIYKPIIALLPIGDLYTMSPREAAFACNLLKPRYIIGMHYGTFPALTGTPGELRKLLPPDMKKRVKELKPGIPTIF